MEGRDPSLECAVRIRTEHTSSVFPGKDLEESQVQDDIVLEK